MNITNKTFKTANIRMWTGGQGEPLLYLHGFEGPVGDAGFLNRLAESYRVVAPEHPGFGESTGFEQQLDITDLVLHYRLLLEDFGGKPVILVGHSLGGMFAAEIAALCPHLVAKLVLVDSYGLWLDDHPMQDPFMLNRPGLVEAKWASKDADTRSSLEARSQGTTEEYRQQNLGSATRFMWPIPDRGLSRRLAAVHAPTLVVHGGQDALVPKVYAQAFADRLNRARVEIIENAGHFPMIEQEETFVGKVKAFLDQR